MREGGGRAGSGAIVKIPRGLDALEIRVINRRNSREYTPGRGWRWRWSIKKREQRLEWKGGGKSLSRSCPPRATLPPFSHSPPLLLPSPRLLHFSFFFFSRFHLSFVESFRNACIHAAPPSLAKYFSIPVSRQSIIARRKSSPNFPPRSFSPQPPQHRTLQTSPLPSPH